MYKVGSSRRPVAISLEKSCSIWWAFGPLKWILNATHAPPWRICVVRESMWRNHSGSPMTLRTSSINCDLRGEYWIENIFAWTYAWTYKTNLGGLSMLTYFTMSWSASILAQANRSLECSGPMMTIDRPKALWSPSSGKFGSDMTLLCTPMSIVPKRAETSPT